MDSAVAGMNGDGAVLLDMVDVRDWYDSIRGWRSCRYAGHPDGVVFRPLSPDAGGIGAALLNDRNQVIAVVQAAAGGGQCTAYVSHAAGGP
ncbi:hypothetical protein RAA17_01785 [Komagataeibacter rhaeticus]|nr:hypothetical protein [Komagataeibacter rhaeticus]